jgi:hypothetical protein
MSLLRKMKRARLETRDSTSTNLRAGRGSIIGGGNMMGFNYLPVPYHTGYDESVGSHVA